MLFRRPLEAKASVKGHKLVCPSLSPVSILSIPSDLPSRDNGVTFQPLTIYASVTIVVYFDRRTIS